MSFRKFGGLRYSSKNNAVSSTFSTVSNLSVTDGVGQANSSLNVFSNFSNNVVFDGKATFNNNLIGQTGTFTYLYANNLSFDGVVGHTGSFSYVNNVNLGSINNDLSFNTFLGANTFSNIIKNNNSTNAQFNTAIGYQTLQQDISGNFNTAIGANSLQRNTYGSQNTALGYQSLQQDVSGNNNTAVGYNAGNTLIKGDYNTFLGANTDVYNTAPQYQYSTAVGYNSKIDASNVIVLGGLGPQGYPSLKIPGNYLGIGGIYDPNNTKLNVLDVSGNAKVSGTLEIGIGKFNAVQSASGIDAPFISSQSYISAPNGTVTGLTGSFNYLVASQGITGNSVSSKTNISAPNGTVTGLTGSFNYLVASQGITGNSVSSNTNIFAPNGSVSGLTGSFNYLVASQGISGPTGYFNYIVASKGITGYTGSFTYLTASTGKFNYVESSIFNATSDYRIKKNVKLLDETFVVDKLNPVIYENVITNSNDVGLIAHEIQEIYPYLVNGKKNGDALQSVNYIGLIPILIKEIKEIKERLKKLEDNAKI